MLDAVLYHKIFAMKKIISIPVILVLFFTSNAQPGLWLAIEDPKMDAYLQNRQPATLLIQINNAPNSISKVDINCTFVSFGPDFQITKYYRTDTHGFVKITLSQNLPYQEIFLSVPNYLFASLYVNTDLKITLDANKIETKEGVSFIGDGLTYSGVDGEFNTVMNKHILYKQDEQSTLTTRLNELCTVRRNYTTNLFSEKTDSIWQALSRINTEFIQQYPDYGWAINNEAASGFYGSLCTAYWSDTMPKNLFARISNHQPYFTSNDGVFFYNYLNAYLDIKVPGIADNIKSIDSIFRQPKADILKMSLLAKGKGSFALTYPVILNSMKTEWCRRLVANDLYQTAIRQKETDSLLASAKQLESRGAFIGTPVMQLPFDASLFTLYSVKNSNDFIVNLKSKFTNKALVIDFWGTWCPPCLNDMPFSKALHEANKDLPVEYVYICTNRGSDIKLWKNKIAELQLPGTHIFMDEKIVEALKSSFNSAGSGFPTYIVVDKNGNLRQKAIERMQFLDRVKLKEAVGQ